MLLRSLPVIGLLISLALPALSVPEGEICFRLPFEGDATASFAAGGREPAAKAGLTFEPGVVGQAVKVGGNEPRLIYPAAGNIDFRRGAISCWVKSLDWDIATGKGPMILRTNNAAQRNFYLGLIDHPKRGPNLWVYFFLPGTGAYGGGGLPEWRVGQWRHVTGNWGDGELAVYVDGKLLGKQAVGELELDAPSFSVGPYRPARAGAPEPLSLIDELAIYRRPLTAAEIGELFTANRPPAAELPPPTLRVAPALGAVTLDGKTDEAAWQSAAGAGGFVDLFTRRIAQQQTRFLVTYDDTRLYLAFETSNLPIELQGKYAERDKGKPWNDDSVEIFIQPDPENTYHLMVNHAGATHDLRSGSADWTGNWQYAGRLEGSTWTGEIAIPLADLGMTKPPAEGTQWRFNLCRDRAAGGKKLQCWADVGGDYRNAARYGYLVFGRQPAVSISTLGEVDFGRLAVTGHAAAGPEGAAQVDVVARLLKPGTTLADPKANWSAFVQGKMVEARTAVALQPGRPEAFTLAKDFFDEDLQVLQLRATCGQTLLYDASLPVRLAPPLNVQLLPLPSQERLEVRLLTQGLRVTSREGLKATVTAISADGEVAGQAELDLPQPEATASLEYARWPVGTHRIVTRVVQQGRTLEERTVQFNRTQRPVWLGTQIGTERIVLPPWTPLQYSADSVGMWGRRAQFSGPAISGFQSQGQEMLAGPMSITATVDGRPLALQPQSVKWLEQAADRGVLETSAHGGGVELTAKWQVEYDGFMWVDLTLKAPATARLENLTVDMPLRRDVAQMAHGMGIARHSGINEFIGDATLSWSRVGFLWLGNHDRGLCYFAESERNWQPAQPEQAIQVVPDGDRVVLRLNVVGKPLPANGWGIGFGLYGTPVKPLPQDWWRMNYDQAPHRAALDWRKLNVRLDGSIIWNQFYLDVLTDPYGAKPVLHDRVKEAHDMGALALPYFAPMAVATDNPVLDLYGREWRVDPPIDFFAYPEKTYTNCSFGGSYSDYLLYGISRMVDEYKIDGVYFDGGAPLMSSNALHNLGWSDERGWRHADLNIRATRELHKRLATMLYQKLGSRYAIYEHVSDCIWLPTATFLTAHLDAEQYKGRKRAKTPYWQILDEREIRPEFVSTQFGVPNVFLAIPNGLTPSEIQADARYLLAWLLPHGVPFYPRYVPEDVVAPVYRLQQELGPEAQFRPYWQSSPAVRVSAPEGLRVSHLVAPGKVMLVLGNTAEQEGVAKVQLDAKALGLKPGWKVQRSFPETSATPAGETISLSVPARSFQLVWLE